MDPVRLRIVPRNFHDESVVEAEIAPVLGYPLEYTQNATRGRVWRSETRTDQYVSGYFEDGLDRTSSFFGIFRHRCHGGQVRLQLYSDVGYASEVFDSGFLDVVNVVSSEGFDWGVDPYGIGSNDPFVIEAPYWLWFEPVTFLSYRISFTEVELNYGFDYWQVSRFFLGNYFEVGINPDYGATLGFATITDRNRSRGGSLRTNVGNSWRTMKFDFNTVDEIDRASWLDIMKYCGTGRDLVVSLFPEDGTRIERDHLVNAKFSSIDPIVRQPNYLTKQIQIEEV